MGHENELPTHEDGQETVQEDMLPKEEERQRPGRRARRWLRRLFNLLVAVIVVPVLVFQIPWVQTKVAKELTAYLSEELQTTVSVGRVSLGIFNRLNLREIYVEDLAGDTLLRAGNLQVNHSGLFMLLFRQFKIETLTLQDADLHLRRMAGQRFDNYQFIVDYFTKGKTPDPNAPPGKPFKLNLRHFYLDNVHFLRPDDVNGEVFDVFVRQGEGHFDKFDLLNKRLVMSSFSLGEPVIKISLLPEKPLNESPSDNARFTSEKLPAESGDTAKMVISIRDFDLGKGRFSLRNLRAEPERLTPPDVLNYNYLDAFDIEIHFNDFEFSELEFKGEIEEIAMRDSSGFVLEKLAAKQAALSCRGMELYGLELRTPDSHLGDTLIFRYGGTYHAWEDFVNEVRMDARFHDAKVALKDIMTFAPVLRENAFFTENQEKIFEIEGQIKGPVNRLDGRKLKINLAEGLLIEGSFSTRNLAVEDEQYIHLDLDRLRTDMRTLRKLIPKFRPPDNFDRMGRLDFSGKFDGFFVDFVADGNLKTDIGSARMFMNLKLRNGKERALYSGDLYLDNFDLGAWTGDKNLGKITFGSHVKQGVGLTLNSANARLEATIDSFRFKGYDYKNVAFKGQLKKNLFDGELNVEDQYINLDFKGSVSFADSLPAFNFEADVRQLALLPLNISKTDLRFLGKVNMNLRGNRLSNIVGTADVEGFQLVKNQKDTLTVDSALLVSTISADGTKHFNVFSNLGTVDIRGDFDIEKIPGKFLGFLSANYPKLAERLKLKPRPPSFDTTRFDFAVEFYQLQNLFGFFEEKISGFDESKISGNYDGFDNRLSAEIEVPHWRFQNITFNDLYLKTKLKGHEGDVHFGVVETKIGETVLPPVSLIGDVFKDTLEFLVIASDFFNILDKININGVLTLDGATDWRISFLPSDLVVLNQKWDVNTANFIRIGNGSVETSNFVLTHGTQRIVLQSIRNEGLELQLMDFPLDSISYVRDVKNYNFDGIADLQIKAKDVFKFQGLSTLLRIDSLSLNGDHYGTLRLDAFAPNIEETVYASLSISHDTMELTLDGYFNPPSLKSVGKERRMRDEPLFFDFDLGISKYPVRIINYFVAEVENVKGYVSADRVRFYGTPSKPELDGYVAVHGAQFTLKPLRTTYRVPEGSIKVSSRLFDGTGNYAYDRFNNRAYLEGGITHDHLKNFGLDLRIATDPGKGFLGLETTAKDNPVFYGTAVGTGYVRFSGNFQKTNLYVNARTLQPTHITIPMTSSVTTKNTRFIVFTEDLPPKGKDNSGASNEPRGLNMEYDLDITPDALMEVIFDKAWGDVLKGTGNGKLKVILTREGLFKMYGDYTVVTGDYLFTLMNLVLNKPFTVEPGGKIIWTGDPYDAKIDVKAVYSGLNASVYSFVQEYLDVASSDLQNLARSQTPVNLKMQLRGKLLKPDIDFDMDFPALESQLRTYAENKLHTIRQDPNELNRQVFGLLVLGQFLPTTYTLQAGDLGLNTLSEMLSNQFSIFLTDLVNNFFTGKGFIKGIDVDIQYSRYSVDGSVNNPTAYSGSELAGRLSVIVSDRISIRIGGNFEVGGNSANALYSSNSAIRSSEFIIDYVLTKDRRLRLNAYQKTEPDIGGDTRFKHGVGLSFRKEFDTLGELLNWKRKG